MHEPTLKRISEDVALALSNDEINLIDILEIIAMRLQLAGYGVVESGMTYIITVRSTPEQDAEIARRLERIDRESGG